MGKWIAKDKNLEGKLTWLQDLLKIETNPPEADIIVQKCSTPITWNPGDRYTRENVIYIYPEKGKITDIIPNLSYHKDLLPQGAGPNCFRVLYAAWGPTDGQTCISVWYLPKKRVP